MCCNIIHITRRCRASQAPDLLRAAGASVQRALIPCPAVPAGAWRVLFRRAFKVPPEAAVAGAGGEGAPPAVPVWATAHVAGPGGAGRFVRLYTVSNELGDVAAHALLRTGRAVLAPSAAGYTLLAAARRAEAPLPAGPCLLSLISAAPLGELTEAAGATEAAYGGAYTPNRRLLLFKQCIKIGQVHCGGGGAGGGGGGMRLCGGAPSLNPLP